MNWLNWPMESEGRVPLDRTYWTADGLYTQGYLEGQMGRHLEGTNLEDIPSEWIMGLQDGYGDWINTGSPDE